MWAKLYRTSNLLCHVMGSVRCVLVQPANVGIITIMVEVTLLVIIILLISSSVHLQPV